MIFIVSSLLIFSVIGFYVWADRRGQAFKKKHLIVLSANIASVIVFALILDGVINRDSISAFNDVVYQWVGSRYDASFASFMLAVTQLADPIFTLLASILLMFLMIVRKAWYGALLSFLALSTGSILPRIIKSLTDIDRPADSLVQTLYASFPSGHATMITIFALLIGWIFRGLFKKLLHRKAFYGFLALIVVLVGFSRMYLGAHWLTDVLAGIALGVFSVTFWMIILRGIVWNAPKLLHYMRRHENPFV